MIMFGIHRKINKDNLILIDMTYTITIAGEKSIYMASDSRLNYHEDKEIGGVKYQKITAIADCIKKTFFIKNLKIGIQFIGIGFLPEKEEKYPLSYFIKKLATKKNISVEKNFEIVFNFFKDLSIKGDTGQYVKGVMSAMNKNDKKVCLFSTFDNRFEIKELQAGQYIDSENVIGDFGSDKSQIIKEIKRRIMKKSQEKWWSIGGEITLLEIKEDSHSFLLDFNDFKGSQKELVRCFNEDLDKIKGKRINPPILEKYDLTLTI